MDEEEYVIFDSDGVVVFNDTDQSPTVAEEEDMSADVELYEGDEEKILETMENQRSARDAALRLSEHLADKATLARIQANALDSQALHILDELEEGGQKAKTMAQKLGGRA